MLLRLLPALLLYMQTDSSELNVPALLQEALAVSASSKTVMHSIYLLVQCQILLVQAGGASLPLPNSKYARQQSGAMDSEDVHLM